ncbi:hypothetical protein DFS33DRAFT_1385623 [Desarmillaria ectypa]|nr:hypothetical protein DFS33DRAFT_1385623 [Desarmillaria ectypa]
MGLSCVPERPKLTSLGFDDVRVQQFISVRESSFPPAQIRDLRIDRRFGMECLFAAVAAFPNIRDLTVYIDRPHRRATPPCRVQLRFPVLWMGTQVFPQIKAPASNLVSCLTWNLTCSSFVPKPFEDLHFNSLDSLLDEEMMDDSLIGVDPISEVVSYSASRLQHITFAAMPISGMDIISIVQILPQIRSLVIHDPDPNDYELPDASLHRLLYPIDEHLLHQLTAPPSGSPFLSRLKSIEWTQDIDESAVIDMIESRRGCDTPLGRATLGKLERHIDLSSATHQRLRDLRKSGLAFSEEWDST